MSKSNPILRKLTTLTVAAAVAAAAMLTVASPANAATLPPPAPSASTSLQDSGAAAEISQDDIDQGNLAGSFVAQSNEQSVFDYGAAVAAGVRTDFAADFATGVVAGGGEITNAPADVSAGSTAEAATILAAAACSGRNGSGVYWWGWQTALDSCNTSVLINAMWAGAGVAALAGIISSETGVGAAAGGIAAAALTIGAGALGICASWGNGIYWNTLYTGTPFCWGQ